MTNDLVKLLAAQDQYARLMGVTAVAAGRTPNLELAMGLGGGCDSGVMKMIEEEDRLRKQMLGEINHQAALGLSSDHYRQIVQGPIEDARRLGMLGRDSEYVGVIAAALKAQTDYESLFRRPEINETRHLIGEVLRAQSATERYLAEQASGMKAAMDAMQAPWLSIEDPLRSAKGLTELLGLGRGVADQNPFTSEVSAVLRATLGDWRDPITEAESLLINPSARLELYDQRGFDPSLTEFTPEAFDQGMRVAGLGPWSSDDADETGAGAKEDEDGEGELRAQSAYRELRRTEKALRVFIARVMTQAYGENWMKAQLPNNMYEAWVEKNEAARRAGASEKPLIDYADFTDYRAIMVKRDNWKTVFKPIFGRQEDVAESFQRLFPVRIATMHAGVITLDDELLLRVETRRIMRRLEGQI